MTTDFYVVRHHGAWRIRVNGKHRGEYNSRVRPSDRPQDANVRTSSRVSRVALSGSAKGKRQSPVAFDPDAAVPH